MNEATEKLLGALRGALDEFEAADRPQVEFPFWCNNNSTPPDPVFVPDNAQPWVLHSNGRWSQALAPSARFVELASTGRNGWHTITEAEALATLEYPIYVTAQVDYNLHRITSPTSYDYYTSDNQQWRRYADVENVLDGVREGTLRILTAAEADAIVKPVPTVNDAAKEVCRVWFTESGGMNEGMDALRAAIAVEEAKVQA